MSKNVSQFNIYMDSISNDITSNDITKSKKGCNYRRSCHPSLFCWPQKKFQNEYKSEIK